MTENGTDAERRTMQPYMRVCQILDAGIGGDGVEIGAHGAFWRRLSRDEFVEQVVFNYPLISLRDGDGSNLVKALRGQPPFKGAPFRRMPAGKPPIPDAEIEFIRVWINEGCPEEETELLAEERRMQAKATDPKRHLDFWREFDNWAMYQATKKTQRKVNQVMGTAESWMAFALDPEREKEWAIAITGDETQRAIRSLMKQQRDTVIKYYGKPLNIAEFTESFEKFGDDSLPNDLQRPQDVRHNMNGPVMWFVWAACIDACLRSSMESLHDFARTLGRGVLVGLINDGLFRKRFPIAGFDLEEGTKKKIREYVDRVDKSKLQQEFLRRFRQAEFTR